MAICDEMFEVYLDEVMKQMKKLAQEIVRASKLSALGEREEAYEKLFSAVKMSEQLTIALRELPSYTHSFRMVAEIAQAIREVVPVKIGYTQQGWFVMHLPTLLPRKESGSAAYIRSILYPVLDAFAQEQRPERFGDCCMIFRHVYDRNRPARGYRDHDNIEINMVVDILALYLLEDDAPLTCRHYYASAPGSGDRTEVYLVPQEEICGWIMVEKTMPDEGLTVLEFPPDGPQMNTENQGESAPLI